MSELTQDQPRRTGILVVDELLQRQPYRVKILIVDDKPVNIQALQTALSLVGYTVTGATSGEEALDKIAKQDFDLVLLDVMMPGMSGFEVCRSIKNNPATLFLPVVLVTGLKGVENRLKGVKAGADEFLSKPVDSQELLMRVKSLVRAKFLHNALEDSNRQVKELLAERTQQLKQATLELRKLLEEKALFSPDLAPPDLSRPQPAPQIDELDGQNLRDFKQRLMSQLANTLEGRTDLARTPEMVGMLSERLAAIYDASGLQLVDEVRQRLFREVVDEILGYGPIEPLLADRTVSEVMVNGPSHVYVERKGRLVKTDVTFDDNDHVMRIIDRIIRPLGRRADRESPMVDARLPDGSRVNAIIPPCAIDGPSITIRKFSEEKLTVDDLIEFGTLTSHMAEFLRACVSARLNIIVSGGTGSGKTTLLNVLSSFVPENERIVTIEDSAELQLDQEHIVRLETIPAGRDKTGGISIRELVRNSLRMRPDRIVVGEVRGGEALDMLQAMNTGHDGSLTTVHANTPRDTIARLETLVLMAGMDLPLKVVRSQIASAVDLIVQQSRLKDGSRKIVNITEVQGLEGDIVVLSDIFVFKEQIDLEGLVVGELGPTGLRPSFGPKLEMAGFTLTAETFAPRPQPQPQQAGRRSRR